MKHTFGDDEISKVEVCLAAVHVESTILRDLAVKLLLDSILSQLFALLWLFRVKQFLATVEEVSETFLHLWLILFRGWLSLRLYRGSGLLDFCFSLKFLVIVLDFV